MLRNIKILAILIASCVLAQAQDLRDPSCRISGTTITCGSSSISGGGSPGGSNTQIQYNNAGSFGGISGWTTNGTTTLTGGTGTTVAISGATIGTNALAAGGTLASIAASGSSPGFYTYLTGDTVARVRIGMDSSDIPSLAFGPGGASVRDTFLYRSGAGLLTAGTTTTLSDATLTLANMNVANTISSGSFVPTSTALMSIGMNLNTAGVLGFVTGGTARFLIGTTSLAAVNTSGPAIVNSAASTTTPTLLPNRSSATAGVGATTPGNMSLIAGSVSQVVIAASGVVTFPTITTDATKTDATACIDTTSKQIYTGTGALGVCLGTSGSQFKRNIIPMNVGIDELMKIDFVNYRYKEGYGDSGVSLQYGTTAQNVEKVIPDIARHNSDGETINFDSGALLFIGLRAIQQLKADNDNLRSELKALKTR